MRDLKNEGMGIIFITHFLDQVFAISDRITVLRNGNLVGSFEEKEITKIELVTQMIGKDMEEIYNLKRPTMKPDAKDTLSCDHIGITGSVQDVSISMKEGELLGFAGLFGSGRTETAEMLFGVTTPTHGVIHLNSKKVRFKEPIDAINRKMAFCPEDRKRDGIIGDLTVRENIILVLQAKQGFLQAYSSENTGGDCRPVYQTADYRHARRRKEGRRTQRRQPAKGDPGAVDGDRARYHDYGRADTRHRRGRKRQEIQRIMLSMCEKGVSVIFISSELDEILRCSNRIVVMRDRSKAGEVDASKCTQADILSIIAGEKEKEPDAV